MAEANLKTDEATPYGEFGLWFAMLDEEQFGEWVCLLSGNPSKWWMFLLASHQNHKVP